MRTKRDKNNSLPDVLYVGQKLISRSGRILIVQENMFKNKKGQNVYLLKYTKQKLGNWNLSEHLSRTQWTRFDLLKSGIHIYSGRTK